MVGSDLFGGSSLVELDFYEEYLDYRTLLVLLSSSTSDSLYCLFPTSFPSLVMFILSNSIH